MLNNILAIATAFCAALVWTFVPEFSPGVMADTSQPVEWNMWNAATASMPAALPVPAATDIRNAVAPTWRNRSRDPMNNCENSWPYYEQSCLRGGSQAGGRMRPVRVIAADRSDAIPPRP
jgi:hypothetical protein